MGRDEDTSPVAVKTSLRVLNVEDNADDAELNAAMITARWPHSDFVRVDTRAEFAAALERENYDLILCDYTIPGFGGLEALAIAREKCPEIPFLFVSGTIGEDTAIEALKNGATDYVLKHRLINTANCLRVSARRRFWPMKKRGRSSTPTVAPKQCSAADRANILGQKQSRFLAGLDKARAAETTLFDSTVTSVGGNNLPVRVHATKLTIHSHPLVLWLCRELQAHP